MSVHILDHPLLQHKLTILRDKNTGTRDFRATVSEIAMLMCYEATRDLAMQPVRCGDSRRHGPLQVHCRQEDGRCAHPPRRSWHGRRYPEPDPLCQGGSYRSVP